MKRKSLQYGLIAFGTLMLLGAAGLTGYNFWDMNRAAQVSEVSLNYLAEAIPDETRLATDFTSQKLAQLDNSDPEVEVPYYVLNPDIEMPQVQIDGVDYIGIVDIPGLELELPVITQWSNTNGKLAPCRYAGSAYRNDLVICAHNYLGHFGNLSDVSLGDTVHFTDAEGNRFDYQVLEVEILPGTAVEDMVSGDWDLTLFTCTTGGRTRLTVRCQRIEA